MSGDFFIRSQLNSLTGLTRYAQDEGLETVLVDGAWTTVHQALASQEHMILAAYAISFTQGEPQATSPLFRILAAPAGAIQPADLLVDDSPHKIFPFGASAELMSGLDQLLQWPLQIPIQHDVYLQCLVGNSDAGGTIIKARLDYLSKIRVPLFENN